MQCFSENYNVCFGQVMNVFACVLSRRMQMYFREMLSEDGKIYDGCMGKSLSFLVALSFEGFPPMASVAAAARRQRYSSSGGSKKGGAHDIVKAPTTLRRLVVVKTKEAGMAALHLLYY